MKDAAYWFWVVARVALGIYLMVGFYVYLKTTRQTEEEETSSETGKAGTGKNVMTAIKTIVLWPGYIGRTRRS